MPEQLTPTPVAMAPMPPDEARPDPLASSVAAAVTKLRRDAGLSERAAAKKLGTSQTQLRRMEDPRYLPSLRSLQRVANAYGAQLKVSFESNDSEPEKREPQPKPASAGKTTKAASTASASPSKARRAAPRRGRAAARPQPRRAAQRRRGR